MTIENAGLIASSVFTRDKNWEINRAAETGIYDIRGFGAKRKVPHFDDLLFLGASVSRYPLEGYREKCATDVVLGDRFAKKPLHLDIPITIAGMSFGGAAGTDVAPPLMGELGVEAGLPTAVFSFSAFDRSERSSSSHAHLLSCFRT